MKSIIETVLASTLLMGILVASGCDQGDIEQVVKGVSEDVAKTTGGNLNSVKPKKAAPSNRNGKGTLQLDKEVKFDASYISLIDLDDRGIALHVRSYAIGDEGVPSYFMQAKVSENSLDSLAGKDVKARVFVRTDSVGGIWSNMETELATLKIEKKKSGYVVKVETAELFNSENGSQVIATGELECVETEY